jgi:hypothetical protein
LEERQTVYVDLDKLHARMLRGVITEQDVDLVFTLLSEQQQRLADVMRAGDLEHARMAAIVEACEALAQFAESYLPDSHLATQAPGFYSVFRSYGKNARAAVADVRPQADALLAKMAELITANTQVAQLNGSYLEALSAAYHALLSYAHGNSAPALAEEVAALVLATIEKASEP